MNNLKKRKGEITKENRGRYFYTSSQCEHNKVRHAIKKNICFSDCSFDKEPNYK